MSLVPIAIFYFNNIIMAVLYLSTYMFELENLYLFLPFRTAKPHPRLGVEMGGP